MTRNDLTQELFAIDMLTAIKSSLKGSGRHVHGLLHYLFNIIVFTDAFFVFVEKTEINDVLNQQ